MEELKSQLSTKVKKTDQQTLSSSAAALQMLSLGSVGKTHVKAESP